LPWASLGVAGRGGTLFELRWFLKVAGSSAVLLLLTACTQHPQAADPSPHTPAAAATGSQTCRAQVIVSFAQTAQNPSDAPLVKDLSRVAGVTLVYLRSVTSSLHLFSLSGVGDDCGTAVERLRGDPRVLSADIDQRRQHH
jgi:hypothetical protein